MSDNKRIKDYDDLPLVLDVADIRRIMGISRVSAHELVHTPGFPAFRSGRLIKVSKKAFFDWMEKGTETVPKDNNLKMIPKRHTKTVYLRMSDRNGERSQLRRE